MYDGFYPECFNDTFLYRQKRLQKMTIDVLAMN